MNIQEINNTITELENGDTTFASCQKLASLYIVKEHLQNAENKTDNIVVKEFNDILPMYSNYCSIKKQYQLNQVTEQAVHTAIQDVSREIKEFIQTLYANVDTEIEKQELVKMITELKALY